MPRFSSPRRVAVTGLGLVSPLAVGNAQNWEALLAGKNGVGPITRFDASPFTCRITRGAACRDINRRRNRRLRHVSINGSWATGTEN